MDPASFTGTFTHLLTELEDGDVGAFDRVVALLYGELHGLARMHRRRWDGDETLGTTVLVHEAYLKLLGSEDQAFESRRHFLCVASRAMRQILCNHARDRRRLKRGGNLVRVTGGLEGRPDLTETDLHTIIALDGALEQLAQISERQAQVVECRFFAGLSIPETAEALGLSQATVKRDWAAARDHLYQTLTAESEA